MEPGQDFECLCQSRAMYLLQRRICCPRIFARSLVNNWSFPIPRGVLRVPWPSAGVLALRPGNAPDPNENGPLISVALCAMGRGDEGGNQQSAPGPYTDSGSQRGRRLCGKAKISQKRTAMNISVSMQPGSAESPARSQEACVPSSSRWRTPAPLGQLAPGCESLPLRANGARQSK